MDLDASSMEKRFAYKFLKKILKYVDSAQEFIAHLGRLLQCFLGYIGKFYIILAVLLLHLLVLLLLLILFSITGPIQIRSPVRSVIW